MADFLLELRSEEIPARMQDKAREDLARLFAAELAKSGLAAAEIETYATPRRLALIAKDLPLETQAVSEETKGPKTSAPPQAIEGFLRKTGLTQDQLVERDGVYFAVVEKPGRKTADVLAEAIPAIIRAFPWPKSQRWGAASLSTESLRWVRPLQGIIALLGDETVACDIDGISSGRTTKGHRFHHSGDLTISSAADYAETLRAAHVIVNQDERRAIIRAGAEKVASDAGLRLVPDEGLVNENSGLTEWPVPMLGRFDPAYLAVPEEVIQLTARVNQKYFICRDGAGTLANAFVCTANIVAKDGGAAIVAGNEKVLAARLSDAKFFWEQDLKVPLAVQAEKLSQIVFHEKLGTVADKVDRVAKLARWLVEEGIVRPSPPSGGEGNASVASEGEGGVTDASLTSPSVAPLSPSPSPPEGGEGSLAALAERAARLCKADLVTGMVGEFPELQGLMGGYYARAQGEDDAVADAIRDHYKPVGQGDDVPTAPVTVAVSLADKLDTLFSFYLNGITPSGSKDPFALRRAELAVIATILFANIRAGLSDMLYLTSKAWYGGVYLDYGNVEEMRSVVEAMFVAHIRNRTGGKTMQMSSNDHRVVDASMAIWSLTDSFPQRLKVQQREAGVRHDLIDAVFALGGEDDLVRLLARVKALQAFVGTDEGANLLAAYKRAANILKASGDLGDRHPELVSGSTNPASSESAAAPWMLKQVQHDGLGDAERALHAALDEAEPKAAAAVAAEQFEEAMAALASLRAPIDAFFEGVMVNDPDPHKRAYRMGLLARFRAAVHSVADFSKIEG